MNKKERKANAILAEAKEFCKRNNIPAPVNVVKMVEREAVKLSKPLPPVVFDAPVEMYDALTIVKMGKGNYRITGVCNGQKVDILNRFKSITKAEEWKLKHLK